MERWGGVLFVVLVAFLFGDAAATQTVGGGEAERGSVLTAQERVWLAAHPTIRLGPEEDYAPISFFDEQGRYRGITADYFALIEQRLGVRFEVVRPQPGADRLGYRDINPISAPSPERLKIARYSSLYLEFPAYVIVRSSVTRPLTPADLGGARVAVVTQYAVQEYLAAQHPDLILDAVPDTRTGLRKVSFGLVDAFVSDLPVATYWMEKEGISNLRIAGESGYVYRMGIGSRGDWPELATILEKGLALVTPAERDEIFRRWVSLPPPPLASRGYVIGLAAALVAAALLVAVVLLWNRSLSSQVARRTQEHKRAEDALRYNEERWQRLSEAAWEGIGLSEDGRLIDANAQLAEMLGFRLDELMGKNVVEFIAPESRPTVDGHIADGTSQAYEHLAIRRDGSVFPVEVRGRTLSREERTIRVTAVRDVSERARLEADLRRAAQEWRDTFDALEAGIVVLGPDRRIQRMNRSAMDALGQGLPRDVPFDELGASEPWSSLVELSEGRIPSGTEVKDPRSGRCWLLVASRLRREAEGESTILVFRNVTETATLRERVQRGEKLAAMGALVAGVAHEVRTPLFSITASLDAFEAEVGGGHTETVSLLRSQAARLTHLMRDLLDYGSPSALRRVTGGVGEALRQAARTCAPLAREAGVEVEVSLGEDLPPVSRDSARLEQVFQNLLANAVQHAPRGSSVRVTVRAAEGPRSGVLIRVEDAGPGLPREDVGRVFQPFFSRRKGGTGLGLSIVQRLVEDHDGTVTGGNQPGGGAVFTVFLPAAEVEAGAGRR
jgi:PAS domain S-box-containing protein